MRPCLNPGEGLLRVVVVAMLWLAVLAGTAIAQNNSGTPPLVQRLTPDFLRGIFPPATRVAALDDGGPTAAAAYADTKLIGYVFSTLDVLRAPGYSATPFDVVAGVTLEGKIAGAAVLFHREPHLADGQRAELLVQFLHELAGVDARIGASGGPSPNFVAGATISARAMRNAVLEGAGLVLRYRTHAKVVTEPTVDMDSFRPMSVPELIADGSLVRVTLTNADVTAAMERAGVEGLPLEVMRTPFDPVYMEFTLGYALPPVIGRNAAGPRPYQRIATFRPGSEALIFGSNGLYDHLGVRYASESYGYRLDRIAVLQGEKRFEFQTFDFINADLLLGRVANIVFLPVNSGFDPLKPWSVEVYAYATRKDGSAGQFLLTSVDYTLPSRLILLPQPPVPPAWLEPWVEQRNEVITLGVALSVLTLILAFQSLLSRSRIAHRVVRNAFLLFTLVWLGWIASAQLSIINVINYAVAPFQGFGIGFYLAEPLIVIIAIYTAVSLLMLGRGVFCGWLCPFGALQELLANVARLLRLPQWNPSEGLQRYLWMGKYASLAVVLALVFLSPDNGAVAEEVEPFKTAITSIFQRGWLYVLYASALLTVGLFSERAFCRFLCPLGGALAILDRLHLINLLKRRHECGTSCSLCERSCPVKAIQKSGKIKMAECFQCLDCQVEYYDDHRCPPLARQRKLRERAPLAPVPGVA